MTKVFYLIIVITSFLACSSNNDNDNKPLQGQLVGRWLQTEIYESDGGSGPTWHLVDDGQIIEFMNNNAFTTSKYPECTEGVFTTNEESEISMNYSCGTLTKTEVMKIKSLTKTTLIVQPLNVQCDEGCEIKYTRIL